MTNSVLVATNSVFLAAPPWTFPTVARTNSQPPSSGIVKIDGHNSQTCCGGHYLRRRCDRYRRSPATNRTEAKTVIMTVLPMLILVALGTPGAISFLTVEADKARRARAERRDKQWRHL